MRRLLLLLSILAACDRGLPTEPVSLTGSWGLTYADTFEEGMSLLECADGTLRGTVRHYNPGFEWERDIVDGSVHYPTFTFSFNPPRPLGYVTSCDSQCRFSGRFVSTNEVDLTSVNGYPFGQIGNFKRNGPYSRERPPGC